MKFSFIYILKIIFYLLDFLFFSKKKDVIFHGYLGVPSGNNLALYKYIKAHHSFQCDLYWTGRIDNYTSINATYARETPPRDAPLNVHLSYLFFLMRFEVIIVESAGDLSFYMRFLSNRGRLKVLLPHGFCLKESGILAPNLTKEEIKIWKKVGRTFNLISVSSKFEKYMVSSTINASPNNCIVMGPQRQMGTNTCKESERAEARNLLQEAYAVNIDNEYQIIFYAPTHRDHTKGPRRPVLFGFDSVLQLNEELIKLKVFLFVREHGLSSAYEDNEASNIIYTSSTGSIDFYHLYAGVDGLITDYSGIFLEYLSSNIKLGFWQYDILDYRHARGFSIGEDVFKSGSQITNPDNFISFLKLTSFPIEIKASRQFWHNLLYENTTERALRHTVNEIKSRSNVSTLTSHQPS